MTFPTIHQQMTYIMKVLFNAGVRLARNYDAFTVPQAVEIPSGCFSSATSCLSYAELSCLGNIGEQSPVEIHRLSNSLNLCICFHPTLSLGWPS